MGFICSGNGKGKVRNHKLILIRHMTNKQNRYKIYHCSCPRKYRGRWASSSPLDVASKYVGHLESDNHLELTRRARLQANHADVRLGIIEVAPG
jgi:hypothetical protein